MAKTTLPDLRALRYIWNWTPILMFHEVLPDYTPHLPPYAITRSGLSKILVDFIERGYSSGSLDDVMPSATMGVLPHPRPKKRMVLTFDDGTRDFVENALPVLEELDITATLFIVAGKVGGRRDWDPLHGDPLAPVRLLDSDELRHLRAQGFTIGSHTYSHCWLPASSAQGHSGPGLSASQARREVLLSREVLSALIGEPVRWFAYPYLGADSRGYDLVREAGYRGACGGPNRKHERYYLNRIDATAYPLPKLRLRCNGLFHIARQLYREARYATRD